MSSKVLLVEDNANNRYLLKVLLEAEGFAVVTANEGKSVVELARRETPDIILLDIQMPEMDGYEVARLLKNDPLLASIPIVGVSSFAMSSDRDKAISAGFAGYIEKPVDPERFAHSVTMILKSIGETP